MKKNKKFNNFSISKELLNEKLENKKLEKNENKRFKQSNWINTLNNLDYNSND